MINSLSSSLPPARDESHAFFSLLKLVTDPAASAKRIAELHAAAEQAVEAVAAAKAATDQLAKDRAMFAAERAKQEQQLENARAAFERDCHGRDQAINDRRAETEKLNREAQTAREEANRIRTDLQARLERINKAAAA